MAPTVQQLSAEFMTEAEKEAEEDRFLRKSKQSPFIPIGEWCSSWTGFIWSILTTIFFFDECQDSSFLNLYFHFSGLYKSHKERSFDTLKKCQRALRY